MKTLTTTTAIILALTLSGSAFADNTFWDVKYKNLVNAKSSTPIVAQSKNDAYRMGPSAFWDVKYKRLIDNNAGPLSHVALNSSSSRMGSQPEIGGSSNSHSLINSVDVWNIQNR
jgi:hypothetical protein